MIDFDTFRMNFPEINENNLVNALIYLKNTPEYDFDMLSTIIAVDLRGKIELNYTLYSTQQNEFYLLKFYTKNSAPSVVSVYRSAYFDECEIYDLFGVNFIGNPNLKRLLMPENWIGHPLLKDYEMNDERLAWNAE